MQLAPTRLTAAQRKDVSDYAAVLQLITAPDAEKVHSSVRQRAKVLQSKVTALLSCWAVTSLSARGRVPLEPGFFDLVVIDEASQCDIASALPMVYRAKRSVVIGDPMQLRHISALSPAPRQRNAGTSMAWSMTASAGCIRSARCTTWPPAWSGAENIVNLRDHHRSHSDIIAFWDQTFLRGAAARCDALPAAQAPGSTSPVWCGRTSRAKQPARLQVVP